MPIKTFLLYLIGDRTTILRMAADRSAVWYGLFFVLISGVAREYDQESLLHNGITFLYPLLLSLPLALLFYGYLYLKHMPKKTRTGLRSYLGLFWMTAPLAWLYALPVEYLFSSSVALRLNMALLAIVATWRVVLFARVIALVLRQRFWQILVEILWGGSMMAFVASFYFSLSIADLMGGTIHSEETELKSSVAEAVFITTFFLGIVLFFVQFIKGKPRHVFPIQDLATPRRVGIPIFLVCASIGMLAIRQPALYRSAHVARLIDHAREEPREALHYLSRHEAEDFARNWPLPPATRGEPLRLYRAEAMLKALKPEHASWILDEIVDYLDIYLASSDSSYGHSGFPIIRVISQLPQSPKADAVLLKHKDNVIQRFDKATRSSHHNMLADLLAAEKRLAEGGVRVSLEKSVLEQLDHCLTRQDEWSEYDAREVLELVSALPANDLTDQYIRDHTNALVKAHALLTSVEGMHYGHSLTNFLHRMSERGIEWPGQESP